MSTNYTTQTLSAEQMAQALDLRPRGKDNFRGTCPSCGAGCFEVKQKSDNTVMFCFSCQDNKAIISELQQRKLWPKGTVKARSGPSKPEIESAQLVVLVGCAAIDRGDDIGEADKTSLLRSARLVRDNPRNSSGGILARRCLPQVFSWEVSLDV